MKALKPEGWSRRTDDGAEEKRRDSEAEKIKK
jgi:hypothetical protein